MSANTWCSIWPRSCIASCRRSTTRLAEALGKLFGVQPDSLELPNILRFGTWVGGDMDGNPDVHAKSIRETLARQQQVIINAYFSECQNLAQLLSQSASRSAVAPELTQRIELYATLVPGAQGITPMRHDRMPYRVFLGQVSERLRLTYDGRPNGYEGPQQFLRDLKLIASSACTPTAAFTPAGAMCSA